MTVTAYEARDLRSLRRPSQVIAYFIVALYFFCAIGEFLNVEWTSQFLPAEFTNPHSNQNRDVSDEEDQNMGSEAIIVIAALQARRKTIAGVLNAFMVFSALSAANSALYISSRILYGLAVGIKKDSNFAFLKCLGSVWHKTGVPMRALFISFVSFIWLPFLNLKGGIAIADVSAPKSTMWI